MSKTETNSTSIGVTNQRLLKKILKKQNEEGYHTTWTEEEDQQIREAMLHKLPKQSNQLIFQKLSDTMNGRTPATIANRWYGIISKTRAKNKEVVPPVVEVVRKKKELFVNERIFNILTQDQKDTLLKEFLGLGI